MLPWIGHELYLRATSKDAFRALSNIFDENVKKLHLNIEKQERLHVINFSGKIVGLY